MKPSAQGWLGVLTKSPELGKVKTRLARTRGSEFALQFATASLLDTWANCCGLENLDVHLVLAGGEPLPAMQPRNPVLPQAAGDLGARMEAALRVGLTHAPFAILIGTDAPSLPSTALTQAAAALRAGVPAVLGPAEDGGFYLIGLRRCPPGLLAELPWSQANTLSETQRRLELRGLKVKLLRPWFDVDDEPSLARLRAELEQSSNDAAPACRQLLGIARKERA